MSLEPLDRPVPAVLWLVRATVGRIHCYFDSIEHQREVDVTWHAVTSQPKKAPEPTFALRMIPAADKAGLPLCDVREMVLHAARFPAVKVTVGECAANLGEGRCDVARIQARTTVQLDRALPLPRPSLAVCGQHAHAHTPRAVLAHLCNPATGCHEFPCLSRVHHRHVLHGTHQSGQQLSVLPKRRVDRACVSAVACRCRACVSWRRRGGRHQWRWLRGGSRHTSALAATSGACLG